MIGGRQWRPTLFVALGFCLLAAPSSALASPNATIINGDVQLRKSYPTFGMFTLLRFRLTAGPSLTIIPKGSRVEVSGKVRIVAKTQEWFETTYVTGTSKFTGWVYAGEVGHRKYVRLDPGVEERLRVAARGGELAHSETWADALQPLFSSTLHAQSSEAVVPPPAETAPVPTLLLGLAYVAIFIGSLYATKKWVFPKSDRYSYMTGLGVLLILGFLSEATFSDMIAKLIVK